MTRTLVFFLCLWPCLTMADESILSRSPGMAEFITRMVDVHGFSRSRLEALFHDLRRSDKVLEHMRRPAESLRWREYRKIFLTRARIRHGRRFARAHRAVLHRAEREYGVPAWLIAAIIGVETRYGGNTGDFNVLRSVATLAFHHETRGDFFRSELEQFLLLTREQGLDPEQLTGSYAGAMGIPQFISSSYRDYAVDFNGDGKIDIWNDFADAIGSVAHYMHRKGWVHHAPVAYHVADPGNALPVFAERSAEPMPLSRLSGLGVDGVRDDSEVLPMRFYGANAEEYWLGFENFRVIMRYNNSRLYALAVYQLGDRIRDGL